MRNDHYPQGTVEALLPTGLVTAATRRALEERLQKPVVTTPRFFNERLFITVRAVCDRLLPQPDSERKVDLAGGLDTLLADGKGNGWRYDLLPADEETFVKGLTGIDETATFIFGNDFYLLPIIQQDAVLVSIQSGTATDPTWEIIAPALFFEELLAAIVELYYSHPYAKEEIGEVAMADAKGWQKIGLNELEAHEPKPLNDEL